MNTYLAHHGIMGQKWGRRRFQYEDGTLTPEGRKRYANANGSLTEQGKHSVSDDLSVAEANLINGKRTNDVKKQHMYSLPLKDERLRDAEDNALRDYNEKYSIREYVSFGKDSNPEEIQAATRAVQEAQEHYAQVKIERLDSLLGTAAGRRYVDEMIRAYDRDFREHYRPGGFRDRAARSLLRRH